MYCGARTHLATSPLMMSSPNDQREFTVGSLDTVPYASCWQPSDESVPRATYLPATRQTTMRSSTNADLCFAKQHAGARRAGTNRHARTHARAHLRAHTHTRTRIRAHTRAHTHDGTQEKTADKNVRPTAVHRVHVTVQVFRGVVGETQAVDARLRPGVTNTSRHTACTHARTYPRTHPRIHVAHRRYTTHVHTHARTYAHRFMTDIHTAARMP